MEEGEGFFRKRPKLYTADGEVVLDEIRPPWARAALRASASEVGTSATPATPQRARDKLVGTMFEKVAAARQELEVILDTLGELERGEHLTVGGVEKLRTTFQTQEPVLRSERKRRQLTSIVGAFRRAHASLNAKMDASEAFYSDLRRLQRRWKVKESAKNAETGFCFDLSLRQLDASVDPVDIRKDQSTGELYVVADVPGEDGASDVRACGAVEVDALLSRLQAAFLSDLFCRALYRKMTYASIRDSPALVQSGLSNFLGLMRGGAAGPPSDEALLLRLRSAFLDMLPRDENSFVEVMEEVSRGVAHSELRRKALGAMQGPMGASGYRVGCESGLFRSVVRAQCRRTGSFLKATLREGTDIELECSGLEVSGFEEGRMKCTLSKLEEVARSLSG